MASTPEPAGARFRAALERVRREPGRDPAPLPECLARAAKEVLAVSGVAVCVQVDGVRVPLGASDALAARAERLQFTLADGPAIDALSTGQLIAADEQAIPERWPLLHRELFASTPFRAVITVPVFVLDGSCLVVDLYLDDSDGLREHRLLDVAAVCDEVMYHLYDEAGPDDAATSLDRRRAWVESGPARRRFDVWIVTGIATERFALDPADAIALLRAGALARETTVDELSADVLGGAVDIDELKP